MQESSIEQTDQIKGKPSLKGFAKCHPDLLRKAASLAVLAVLSILTGTLCDYIAYLFVGPTSLGEWCNPYWLAFFAIVVFIAGCFYVFRNDLESKPENLFLCIVLCISLFQAIAFSVNPVSWDIHIHYQYGLEYSEFDRVIVLNQSEAEIALIGENIVKFDLQELSDWIAYLDSVEGQEHGYTLFGKWYNAFMRIASMPASLVLMIMGCFNCSVVSKYIAAHLTFAVIYSVVTYFGMRRLKSGKMIFAAIALIPTMVFIASVWSYDYWINAFSMFGAAYLIGELQRPNEKLKLKNAVLMLGSMFIAFGPKAVYFPFLLMCLLMPKAKFETAAKSRWYRVAVVGASLLVALTYLVPFLSGGDNTTDPRGGTEVSSGGQLSYILSNPIAYAGTFFTFLWDYLALPTTKDYLTNYAYLGYSGWVLWVILLLEIVFVAITDKAPCDRHVGTWVSRIVVIVVSFATITLVVTALYMSFTPVGADDVIGCQPRYLLPLLFPFLAFMGTYRFQCPRPKAEAAIGDDGLDASDGAIAATLPRSKAVYNGVILAVSSAVLLIGIWQVYIGLLH